MKFFENIKSRLSVAAFFITAVIISSCGEESYSEYSNKYQVAFNCSLLKYQQEFSAINGLGVSQFITLRRSGAKILLTTPNGSELTDNFVTTNGVVAFGYAGLIVGRSTFLNGNFCCFDLACPNCENHSKLSRLIITQTTGHSTCPTCHNVYGLNNNGALITRADSSANSSVRPLFQYRLLQSSTQITLTN